MRYACTNPWPSLAAQGARGCRTLHRQRAQAAADIAREHSPNTAVAPRVVRRLVGAAPERALHFGASANELRASAPSPT
jgi:hypothetical protein